MTTRWILIEKNSGYIWGDSAAMDFEGRAVDYAKALDESLGEHGRTYEHTGSSIADGRVAGIEGYFVYAGSDDPNDDYYFELPAIENGRDQETINSVMSYCRRCGFIVVGHVLQ